MQRIANIFLKLIPVFVFFFSTFSLINMTIGLMLRNTGMQSFNMAQVALGSVIIAKVFLVLDHLSFMNAFSKKPLLYSIAWKSSFYFIGAVIIQFATRLSHYLWKNPNPSVDHFLALFDWPKFFAVQIWFVILLVIFVSIRAFQKAIGSEKLKKIFLGS